MAIYSHYGPLIILERATNIMSKVEYCGICKPKNKTIYFHTDENTGAIWLYCCKCSRGYSLERYCRLTGVSPEQILSGDIEFQDSKHDEVNALSWSPNFLPLSDPRAQKGAEYVKSRGLSLDGDMYYDTESEGIVFPYYLGNTYCGAQIRFIEPRKNEDGSDWKITTVSGTRLGLLVYNWNQEPFMAGVKGIIVTEGAFNSLAIQQSMNKLYGSIAKNPWRAVACSGSGGGKHHLDIFKSLKDKGYKVILAADTDEAGLKMTRKFIDHGSVSHYVFTGDTECDWNDLLKKYSQEEFAKIFIKNIKKI